MKEFDKQMEMVLYHSDEGDISVDAYIKDESLWITQKAMADLFGIDKSGISRHLKKIFETGELDEKVVVAKFATTSRHGAITGKTQSGEVMYYNLDAIISVGYRVNSKKATQFRIWATKVLKEYMIKGFVLDDDRLKQGKTAFGKDYFRELLERVRSIRASERRIWQQITDIFAECSIDYTKDSEEAEAPENEKRKFRPAGLIAGLATAVLFVAMFMMIYISNAAYLRADMQQQQAISDLTVLTAKIKTLDGYTDNMKVCFVMEGKRDKTRTTNKEFENITFMPYTNVYPYHNQRNVANFLEHWCGFAPTYVSQKQFKDREEVKAMPSYPDDGSIKIIDDTVVIKW